MHARNKQVPNFEHPWTQGLRGRGLWSKPNTLNPKAEEEALKPLARTVNGGILAPPPNTISPMGLGFRLKTCMLLG